VGQSGDHPCHRCPYPIMKQVLSSSWDWRPFGHNRHGPKIGGLRPYGGLGPHLTQCRLGRGLAPYQVASWSIQPFGHNRHGPKIGVCPFGDGELCPHLTQYGQSWGLPPCQVSSWLIKLFGYNTLTSQTGQTDRQRSDSTGRSVLQTVAQKPNMWQSFFFKKLIKTNQQYKCCNHNNTTATACCWFSVTFGLQMSNEQWETLGYFLLWLLINIRKSGYPILDPISGHGNIHMIINKSSAVAEMGESGHNRHGLKGGGCCALSWSAGNPSNTMWPVRRSTSIPSGILVHPAVWPQ